jgi:putative transposase
VDERVRWVRGSVGPAPCRAWRHATDLTDDQWQLVRDLFDPPDLPGAPARIPRQRMVDAILYQARTGCQWRYLPPPFGPWGAIWQQFRR